jgi:hypothetical protein
MSLVKTKKYNNKIYKVLKNIDTYIIAVRDQVLFCSHNILEIDDELNRICL